MKWSPTLAYLAGLVATDGNIAKQNLAVSFYNSEPGLIDTYQTLLARESLPWKTYSRQPERGKTGYKVYTIDYSFAAAMIAIGIVPAKSRIMQVALPQTQGENWFWLFFRGVFEGDGSINKDTRHGTPAQISVINASPPFLEWLQQETHRRGFYGAYISKHSVRNAWTLHFLREHTVGLRWHMYDKWPEYTDVGHPKKKAILELRKFEVDKAYWVMKWRAYARMISSYLFVKEILGHDPRWKEYSIVYKHYQSLHGQTDLFSPNKVNVRFGGWGQLQEYVDSCSPALMRTARRRQQLLAPFEVGADLSKELDALNFRRHVRRGVKATKSSEELEG